MEKQEKNPLNAKMEFDLTLISAFSFADSRF